MKRCSICNMMGCEWNIEKECFEFETSLDNVKTCGCGCHRDEKIKLLKLKKKYKNED